MDHPAILPTSRLGQDGGVVFFAHAERRRLRSESNPGSTSTVSGRASLRSRCTAWRSFPSRGRRRGGSRPGAHVAWALEDAHAIRVVHCDVKPADVFLDRSNEERTYLIDFGMGRDLDAMPQSPSESLAGAGAVHGTGEAVEACRWRRSCATSLAALVVYVLG